MLGRFSYHSPPALLAVNMHPLDQAADSDALIVEQVETKVQRSRRIPWQLLLSSIERDKQTQEIFQHH
jgi:hypothetical protein